MSSVLDAAANVIERYPSLTNAQVEEALAAQGIQITNHQIRGVRSRLNRARRERQAEVDAPEEGGQRHLAKYSRAQVAAVVKFVSLFQAHELDEMTETLRKVSEAT